MCSYIVANNSAKEHKQASLSVWKKTSHKFLPPHKRVVDMRKVGDIVKCELEILIK